MAEKIVKVGVGVLVFKNSKVLMLHRQGAHGAGTWAPPGGHIEFGETFAQTARREVKEESNLNIKNIRFIGATNDYFKSEDKHYVTIYMMCDWASGNEKIVEPHKCTEMAWYPLDDLPHPLFLCTAHMLTPEGIDKIKQLLR